MEVARLGKCWIRRPECDASGSSSILIIEAAARRLFLCARGNSGAGLRLLQVMQHAAGDELHEREAERRVLVHVLADLLLAELIHLARTVSDRRGHSLSTGRKKSDFPDHLAGPDPNVDL